MKNTDKNDFIKLLLKECELFWELEMTTNLSEAEFKKLTTLRIKYSKWNEQRN